MYDLIRQDQAYHLFADGRSLLGIVNAADTLSSAAFFIAGALGLIFLWRERAWLTPGASWCPRKCVPTGSCSAP